MTREDIIRMAREVGLWPSVTDTFPKELQDFADLVAAAEREKIAQIIKDSPPLVAATIRERGKP
jgi:hypothetical protein